jgi:hypothetical protein
MACNLTEQVGSVDNASSFYSEGGRFEYRPAHLSCHLVFRGFPQSLPLNAGVIRELIIQYHNTIRYTVLPQTFPPSWNVKVKGEVAPCIQFLKLRAVKTYGGVEV